MVFYRKYRPQKLADLVGRENIAKTLLGQLESGKIGHGYLFYGTRGTGKTSTARILAKAVNCQVYSSRLTVHGKKKSVNRQLPTVNRFGEPCNKCLNCLSITDGSNLDLVEIDAASNRGIDEIRDLREKVKLSPVSLRFKVYIIDEAHMLTNEAFNALLKTLEEPPAHVIFILATTELSRLPATIVSRLQKFSFNKASKEDIAEACRRIAKKEGIKIEGDALMAIAASADGSFRDAVSILDQLSSSRGTISRDDVLAIAKVADTSLVYSFLENLSAYRLKEAVLKIEKIVDVGGDIAAFARQSVGILEHVLLVKIGLGQEALVDFETDEKQKITVLADSFEVGKLQELIRLIISSEMDIKLYPLSQIPLILAVCKYCEGETEEEVQEVQEVREVREVEVEKVPREERVPRVPRVQEEGDKGTEGQSKKVNIESDEMKTKTRSKKSAKALADVEKSWPDFLNKVRPINAHVVALLRSTKPTDFDGKHLTLEVFYRFHKDKLEEPRIVQMLDSVMQEVMDAPIRLKFSLAKKESTPTVAVGKSDVVDIKAEELESIAQEIFSK